MTTPQPTPATIDSKQQKMPTGEEAKLKDSNPYLSASQEAALEKVGVNPATLPTSVTDTQKTCLINAVGEVRANEIKAGAMPTVTEILKAKACF